MSFDEDTGKEILCPYCKTAGDCSHHLLTVDTTFGEVLGGLAYDKFADFSTLIEQAFAPLLADERAAPGSTSWELKSLWQEAVDNYEEGEAPYIDGPNLASYFVEVLENAGAVQLNGVSDDDRPGGSSAYAHLYAEVPSAVVEKAFKDVMSVLAP